MRQRVREEINVRNDTRSEARNERSERSIRDDVVASALSLTISSELINR